MYSLAIPKRYKEGHWFIATLEASKMYLRPDLTIKNGTGHSDEYNVGYWPTEELAWKAYKAYYAKYKPKRIFTTSKG